MDSNVSFISTWTAIRWASATRSLIDNTVSCVHACCERVSRDTDHRHRHKHRHRHTQYYGWKLKKFTWSGTGNASNFNPMSDSIRWYSSTSYWVTMVRARPACPARAVLPTRCIYLHQHKTQQSSQRNKINNISVTKVIYRKIK